MHQRSEKMYYLQITALKSCVIVQKSAIRVSTISLGVFFEVRNLNNHYVISISLRI